MDPCAVNSSEEEGEIPIDSPCHKDNRAAQDNKNKASHKCPQRGTFAEFVKFDGKVFFSAETGATVEVTNPRGTEEVATVALLAWDGTSVQVERFAKVAARESQ